MEDQRRSKVLVVDDDDRILDRLWEVLTPVGYKVQTASDGLDAVRRLEETRFEVVLTDFHMPGMNGLELLALISKRWPGTRVVILSSIPPGSTSQLALQQGAYAWLSKPYKADHLLETLEAAVLTGGPSSHAT
ncbi:MAG TPA: response regulator [Nitrospirales bacterium]|jgi:DNA-binding NtrC family response regulator|nr:response regulator [Nitrospirales bacterium]